VVRLLCLFAVSGAGCSGCGCGGGGGGSGGSGGGGGGGSGGAQFALSRPSDRVCEFGVGRLTLR
jgi:hypothetical protein